MVEDGKQETAQDFNSQADKYYAEKDNSLSESSADKQLTGKEAEGQDESGADHLKNAAQSGKEAEQSDADKAIADKLAKIADILGDDSKAIEAYIKQRGYGKDPAWQRLLAKARTAEAGEKPVVDETLKQQIDEFKKTTSSPEYVRFSMKQQGYTDEAINAKLKELGHEVQLDSLDIDQRRLKRYNIDPMNYTTQEAYEQAKGLITDVGKISRDEAREVFTEMYNERVKPMENDLDNIKAKESAHSYAKQMRETVKNEGLLDFEKEVEPALNKFLDENPNVTQEDVLDHFYKLNHELAIAKLTTKGKKEERDGKLNDARSHKSGINIPAGKIEKTGDFDKDFDTAYNAIHSR